MRIENIGAPKNWPENLSRPELSEGDVLIAEVTDVRGDRVLLKNQNGGAAFSARLLSDLSVAVGDFVETVVDEASGGRFVLRVLDISRQSPFATQSELAADMQAAGQAARAQALLGALAMLKNNPGADPRAAAFLSRHALGGAAENIEAMSQMAKGVSPLASLVSELVGILGAGQPARDEQAAQSAAVKNAPAQSPEAQSPPAAQAQPALEYQPPQGQPSTPDLPREAAAPSPAQATAGEAAPAAGGGTADTPAAAVSGDEQSPAVPARVGQDAAVTRDAQTDGLPDARAAQPRETQAGRMEPAQPMPDTAGTPAAPQAQPVSAQTPTEPGQTLPVPAQAQPVQPDTAPGVADETAPVRQEMPEGRMPAPESPPRMPPDAGDAAREAKTVWAPREDGPQRSGNARVPDEPLMQKALELLVVADDAEKLAAQLKKAVREMPEQLKELKLLARDADSIVREAVSSKLGMAEKQMSLMSEVKRFDCYQIPLQTAAQQPATAELYVYRSRGGKKAVDPDNILILLGLDTQHMGRVETLVRTSGKSLGIEFNLEDMRLGDEMLADAARLKEAVNRAGYSLLGVSVKQLAARTTVLNAEERFEKESGDSTGNLDVRI